MCGFSHAVKMHYLTGGEPLAKRINVTHLRRIAQAKASCAEMIHKRETGFFGFFRNSRNAEYRH